MKRTAKPILRVRQKLCNACMSCQVYCSTAKEGICSPSLSRVRVTLDPFDAQQQITICRQCKEAKCAEACPEDAIQLSEDGRYWDIDYTLCTSCRECVEACPFNSMFYDADGDRVFKCDTCHGEPLCARVCPTGALTVRDQ